MDDLDDVKPEEENLNAHTFQVCDPAWGDHSLYGGLVTQFVGVNFEVAGSLQMS